MLVNNRRNEIEIVREILVLAKRNVKKTHIFYDVKLSYTQLVIYLNYLLRKKLIVRKNNIYKITGTGLKALKSIDETIRCLV